jgi:uncharacterized membrane protein
MDRVLDKRVELEDRVRQVLTTQAADDARCDEQLRAGQRAADRVTRGGGSWTFIFVFLGAIAVWICLNSFAWSRHWDPYPFILLNLVLSVLAAVQAPLIMMSQNRDQARDRRHAEAEFRSSVRAEILLDHLTTEIEDIRRLLDDSPTRD